MSTGQHGRAALLAGLLGLLAGAAPASADGGAIVAKLPDEIDPNGRYVFYSHGAIAEGGVKRPRHPRFGVYHLPEIRAALADPDWLLVAPRRPRQADAERSAAWLVAAVERLLESRVPARNIALVGFSKGGRITALASGVLAPHGIDTALLASCWDWVPKSPRVALGGRVLSIYEASDFAGSCRALAERGEAVTRFDEIVLRSGRGHGEFYAPRPEWREPLERWLRRADESEAGAP